MQHFMLELQGSRARNINELAWPHPCVILVSSLCADG